MPSLLERTTSRLGPAWRSTNFRLSWSSFTISFGGTMMTQLALPLTAVVVLHASPAQMGLLGALQNVPRVGLVLLGGIWADRIRRQPFLVFGEFLSAALIGSIPVAAALGWLSLGQLFVIGLLWGTAEAFLDPAWGSFFPTAVGREHLADANRIFHTTAGGLSVVAPPLAGALVQTIGAPFVMAFDAASYVVSGGLLARLRVVERPAPPREERSLWRDLTEGLRLIWPDRILRSLTFVYGVWQFAGWGMVTSLWVLFLRRTLQIAPVWIGGLGAVGGVTLMVSMWVSPRLHRRIGFGPLIVLASAVFVVSAFLIPMARRGSPLMLPILAAATVTGWGGVLVMNMNLQTLRQIIVPDRMLGRVSASAQFIGALLIPMGALAAGSLAEAFGIRPTLWIAASLHPLLLVALLRSPIPAMHELPPSPDPPTEESSDEGRGTRGNEEGGLSREEPPPDPAG